MFGRCRGSGSLFKDGRGSATGGRSGRGSCGSDESWLEALDGDCVRTWANLESEIGWMAVEYLVRAIITGCERGSLHVFSD